MQISRKFKVPLHELIRINPGIKVPRLIYPKQVLNISCTSERGPDIFVFVKTVPD